MNENIIKQYKNDIVRFEKSRKILLTWGIIVVSLSLTLLVTFIVLFATQLSSEINGSGETATNVGLMVLDWFMIIISVFSHIGGIAMIVLSCTLFPIRINNRKKKLMNEGIFID